MQSSPSVPGTEAERPDCPHCGEEASRTSWAAAPNQYVCVAESCPIVSWREDRR